MKHKQYGFTIVELLIVIVVIAILATISIVAYNGIQNRAHDTAVQSDLANISKKLEITRIDLDGNYPTSHTEFPQDVKLTQDSLDTNHNNVYFIVNTAMDTYALGVRSKSGQGFILTNGRIIRTTVSGATTASAVGITWSGDNSTYRVQGYSSTGSTRWHADFPLVQF